jgi:hypothetical protein
MKIVQLKLCLALSEGNTNYGTVINSQTDNIICITLPKCSTNYYYYCYYYLTPIGLTLGGSRQIIIR